jgi:hypothetical protein
MTTNRILVTRITALGAFAFGSFLGGCDPSHPPHGGGQGDAPMCGGFAGVACPGGGLCVDDPDDGCDPESGGADCSGHCACNALGLCVEGMVWDSSPYVCNCVSETYDPCIATLCPVGTTCVNQNGEGVCVSPDAGAGERCGEEQCGPGLVCCNSSCGICTEPGGVCIQIACED